MEAVLSVPAPKRKRTASYVVVLRGRVVFESETLSEAGAWRDGFGSGQIFERVQVSRPRTAVTP
jgi:hypothetical protein